MEKKKLHIYLDWELRESWSHILLNFYLAPSATTAAWTKDELVCFMHSPDEWQIDYENRFIIEIFKNSSIKD